MQCDRCKKDIEKGDAQEFHGQTLCEDCYMDVLSPVKTCDPWAVHSAKSFAAQTGKGNELTGNQQKILKFLSETKGAELSVISVNLGIAVADLERDIAALRHMEKIRAQLRDGKKVICLW
jgi:hypothetical protein